MTKIIFKYTINQDARNWMRFIYRKASTFGIPRKAILQPIPLKILKKTKVLTQDEIFKLIKYFLAKQRWQRQVIKIQIEALQKAWRKIEIRYFKTLSKITQQPIYSQSFTGYFTTLSMCPYFKKDGFFIVSSLASLRRQLNTIAHETMHMQFEHYYYDYCLEKGLTSKQRSHLKEALTFLLNEKEFQPILLEKDKGYAIHQALRKKLEKTWQKEKNFKKFLDQATRITKKETA